MYIAKSYEVNAKDLELVEAKKTQLAETAEGVALPLVK